MDDYQEIDYDDLYDVPPRHRPEENYQQLTRQLCGILRKELGCLRAALETCRELTRDKLWFHVKEIDNCFQDLSELIGKKLAFGIYFLKAFNGKICMLKQYVTDWNYHCGTDPATQQLARKELLNLVLDICNFLGWTIQNKWASILYGDMDWYEDYKNYPERMPIPEASDEQPEQPLPITCDMPLPRTVQSADSVPAIHYQPVSFIPDVQPSLTRQALVKRFSDPDRFPESRCLPSPEPTEIPAPVPVSRPTRGIQHQVKAPSHAHYEGRSVSNSGSPLPETSSGSRIGSASADVDEMLQMLDDM